jgi:23S rRNA pseudouridine1911/1915/1917 synthase
VREEKKLNFKVLEGGSRLDIFLASQPDITSRSMAEKLIQAGLVVVSGQRRSKHYRVKKGDKVEVRIPPKAQIQEENIPLSFVYEDRYLAVVSKPAGMVSQADARHTSGTLVNALLFHLSSISSVGAPNRSGIVHRLDKETSGLLIVAKTEEAHLKLSESLKRREIKRKYLALVVGEVPQESGVVVAPVGRSYGDRKKMGVNLVAGKEAVTRFKVLKRFNGFTLLELDLETGRTHQIRVHMNFINHPVVGDPRYGGRKAGQALGLKRQFLHAYQIHFMHPITGQELSFEDELPPDLKSVLRKLG